MDTHAIRLSEAAVAALDASAGMSAMASPAFAPTPVADGLERLGAFLERSKEWLVLHSQAVAAHQERLRQEAAFAALWEMDEGLVVDHQAAWQGSRSRRGDRKGE
jgi:hypothetical protein